MPNPARTRYALAYAPNPGSLGWLAGSQWLGRCAALLQPVPQLQIDGVPPQALHQLTAVPRQLGWRAALVPDFELPPGADWLDLHQAVYHLAQTLPPQPLPLLHVQTQGDALNAALVLAPALADPAQAALLTLATKCRQGLHALVAAPQPGSESGAAPQPPFHLPLTGPLHQAPPSMQATVREVAHDFFSDLPALRIDSLALFSQTAPDADFVLLDHVEMRG